MNWLLSLASDLVARMSRITASLHVGPAGRANAAVRHVVGATRARPLGTGRDTADGGAENRAYATKCLQEIRAFTDQTPLIDWLAYTREDHAASVKAYVRRAVAARATLQADLSELLRGSGATEAMTYLCEEMSCVGPELREPVRAAFRRLPEQLRRLFRDSAGVREDMGVEAVRLALATADKFGSPERTAFLPEIAELRRTFAFAPRIRCVWRASRFVEEKIRVYDAERLLDAWIRQNPVTLADR